MGININQVNFPETLSNPVSLKQITGQNFSVIGLAKKLCDVIEKEITKLHESGFDKTYQEYLSHLYKIGQAVRLKKDNAVFTATIKSVTPKGKLLVHHSVEEEFDFGSVEWLV
jgi:BirA family biotin operon repressor/biotin-[acetyl-CoA-carboxylase] ligase